MLSIDNLSFYYKKDKCILKDVSVDIKPGINVLLGKNGVGKSTLIRILAKVQKSSSRISLNGLPISHSTYLDHIAYLPQNFSLYENLKVCEIIEFVASMKGIQKEERKNLVNTILEQAHITEYKNMFFSKCSEGTKRRVGIAALLIGKYDLYLLDEPTAGLDPVERNNFYSIVKDNMKDKTVIISTHIMDDLAYMSDFILMLSDKKISFYGDYSTFLNSFAERLYEIISDSGLFENDPRARILSKKIINNKISYHVLLDDTEVSEWRRRFPSLKKISPDIEDVWTFYK